MTCCSRYVLNSKNQGVFHTYELFLFPLGHCVNPGPLNMVTLKLMIFGGNFKEIVGID